MLTKIILFFQIRKFYNIFGDEVGSNFITKLSDMTDDNVMSVVFDINEILETYEGFEGTPIHSWLTKLERKCSIC